MDILELVNKRVLVAEKTSSYGRSSQVTEFLIMEVSPSKNFIKVRDFDGRRYWRASVDIQVIEVLGSIEKAPKRNDELEAAVAQVAKGLEDGVKIANIGGVPSAEQLDIWAKKLRAHLPSKGA